MPFVSSKTRIYAFAAAVWAALYLGAYLVIVSSEGNGVAWWYVALIFAAVALTVAAGIEGATSRASKALLVALIVLGFAALMAVLTIGILLLPAIIATAIAAGAVGREPVAR
jgi:hypothetical protein